jgi:dihydroorotate dehydrogenase electron transfer subunit
MTRAAEPPTPLRALADVVSNQAEGGANRRLILAVRDWAGFEPGQFAMLSPGALGPAERSDPLLPRPMAVYRETRQGDATHVEVLYKVAGRGTALMADALPGQRVAIVGPLGRPFPPPREDERVVIVAGGTGIASVYELASRASADHRVQVLLGARSEDDLMARADFEKLGVELSISTDDGSLGAKGLVTELLSAELQDPQSMRIYTCGPTPMMHRCAQLAADAGVPCVAALENTMACGFGVCLGCAAPKVGGGYALVCREGPAFDAAQIEWDRLP